MLKVSRVNLPRSSSSYNKYSHANKSAKKSNGLTLLSIKSTGKTRNIHKNLQKKFYIKGEVTKKAFKFMQANMSSNIIIGGILPSKPAHPFSKNAKEKLN